MSATSRDACSAVLRDRHSILTGSAVFKTRGAWHFHYPILSWYMEIETERRARRFFFFLDTHTQESLNG